MKETRLLGCRVWFFRLFWGFCGFPLGYTREGERDRDAREEGESVGRDEGDASVGVRDAVSGR